MKEKFWHNRWETDDIGFHRSEVNPMLIEYFPRLESQAGQTILVPLCGKSLDMLWLAEQGLQVIGVELSEIAAKAFFHENNLRYEVEQIAGYKLYRGEQVQIFVGDFFNFDAALVGGIDLVFDRAALIALPSDMRQQYAATMIALLDAGAKMLLLTMAYDFPEVSGPPFSVSDATVSQLYTENFAIETLLRDEVGEVSERMRNKGITHYTDYAFKLIKN